MRNKLPLVKQRAKLLGKCGLSALVISLRMMTILICAFRTGVLHEKIVGCRVLCNSRLWACWVRRQGSGWQGQSPRCSDQGLIQSVHGEFILRSSGCKAGASAVLAFHFGCACDVRFRAKAC